jgi:hypothetical protein
MKFNILILTVSEAEKYRTEREQCAQIIEARAWNLLHTTYLT